MRPDYPNTLDYGVEFLHACAPFTFSPDALSFCEELGLQPIIRQGAESFCRGDYCYVCDGPNFMFDSYFLEETSAPLCGCASFRGSQMGLPYREDREKFVDYYQLDLGFRFDD